jgi:hypothetical protein
MECNKHKTYQGVRAPKDCPECWKIYFSTDTEKKKKKYPTEYEKWVENYDKKPTRITTSVTTSATSGVTIGDDGKKAAEIPIRLNTYYWSEALQATVKLVSYSGEGLIGFLVDQRLVMPLNKVKDLKLIPYSKDFFIYTTRRTPVEAQNKTITVYPEDESRLEVVGVQKPKELTNTTTWIDEEYTTEMEDCPSPDKTTKKKSTKTVTKKTVKKTKEKPEETEDAPKKRRGRPSKTEEE